MKTKIIILLLLISTCVNSQTVELDKSKSKVFWKGYKVGGSHEGIVDIKSSHFEIVGDEIKKAKIVIDMQSIVITDIESKSSNQKLMDVFRSPSFFNPEQFPTATFTFSSTIDSTIKGLINIKDIQKPIIFPIKFVSNDHHFLINGVIKINRQDFSILYDGGFFSALGDKMIKDDFEIKFNLYLNKKD